MIPTILREALGGFWLINALWMFIIILCGVGVDCKLLLVIVREEIEQWDWIIGSASEKVGNKKTGYKAGNKNTGYKGRSFNLL